MEYNTAEMEKPRLYRVENGKIILTPHPGQARVLQSKARFVLMLAGSQGGKTSFGPWWLYFEIMKRGGGDYLAIAPSYALFDNKQLPAMLEVFRDVLRIGRYWPTKKILEICEPKTGKFAKSPDDAMWARVILRSAEAPEGLESATVNAAWMDEAGMDTYSLDMFYAIQRRLALNKGRILATTTPYNMGWLYQHWYTNWVNGDPDYDVIKFGSSMNPSFSEEELERLRKIMPEWKFRMMHEAEFVQPEGLIYSDFDRTRMTFVYQDGQHLAYPNIVGVDFGGANNATVYAYLAPPVFSDASGPIVYVYREHIEGNIPISEHVRRMKERLEGVRDYEVVGGSPGESQIRRDWSSFGIEILPPPSKEVEVGIDAVISLIRQRRLYVASHLKGLLADMASYRREVDNSGNITDRIVAKESYHLLDALRYIALHVVHRERKSNLVMPWFFDW